MKLYLKTLILCVLSFFFVFNQISFGEKSLIDEFTVLAGEEFEKTSLRIISSDKGKTYLKLGEKFIITSYIDKEKEFLSNMKKSLYKLVKFSKKEKNGKIKVMTCKHKGNHGKHGINAKAISLNKGKSQYFQLHIVGYRKTPLNVKVYLANREMVDKFITALEKSIEKY